jgi:hypothetical protein
MEKRLRLGEMLLRANVLNDLQLKTALAEQQKWGGRLGKILVDMNYVSEDLIIKALSRQLNLPRVTLESIQVPPQVLMKLDRTFCEQNLCVPCAYSHNDRALQVAMTDPTNLRLLDELKFRTGLRISPALAGEKAIAQAVGRMFHSETLAEDGGGELKITGNSGNTVVRALADIQPPAAMAPPPAPAPQTGGSIPAFGNPTSQISFPPPPAASGVMEELTAQQRRQTRAIKTVLELLVEKGVFSRDEYMAWFNRRSG